MDSSRAGARYLRGSDESSCANADRTAPVNAMFSAVPTLILAIPAATAARSSSSGTPEEPCSTSGTGTAERSAAISSRSSVAVRLVIACELPTATASASTPVTATNARASSGSVRTPAACALAGAWGLPPP